MFEIKIKPLTYSFYDDLLAQLLKSPGKRPKPEYVEALNNMLYDIMTYTLKLPVIVCTNMHVLDVETTWDKCVSVTYGLGTKDLHQAFPETFPTFNIRGNRQDHCIEVFGEKCLNQVMTEKTLRHYMTGFKRYWATKHGLAYMQQLDSISTNLTQTLECLKYL